MKAYYLPGSVMAGKHLFVTLKSFPFTSITSNSPFLTAFLRKLRYQRLSQY